MPLYQSALIRSGMWQWEFHTFCVKRKNNSKSINFYLNATDVYLKLKPARLLIQKVQNKFKYKNSCGKRLFLISGSDSPLLCEALTSAASCTEKQSSKAHLYHSILYCQLSVSYTYRHIHCIDQDQTRIIAFLLQISLKSGFHTDLVIGFLDLFLAGISGYS